jgi:hypothetical protein
MPGLHCQFNSSRDQLYLCLLINDCTFYCCAQSSFYLAYTASAQPIVKGKIENETGSPLQGASIQVKGKSAAQTTTAKDGSFSIAASASDILLISYVGYEPIEVTTGAANTIVLKSDNRNMNEVVVTALGIKKETPPAWLLRSGSKRR